MAVLWRPVALESRLDYWRAMAALNPDAAERQDAEIERLGESLDGIATYQAGPVAGTHIVPAAGGRFVLIYQRHGQGAEILDVVPARSNWKPEP